MNKSETFVSDVESIILDFKQNGYFWDSELEFIKSPDFYSLNIHHKDFPMKLKIDFVNDIEVHFGNFNNTELFYKTDSIRNILSNKITATFRFAMKDIVDIREICLHENFSWEEIFVEVRQKSLGVEPCDVAQIIAGTPKNLFDKIKWISKPEKEKFFDDLKIISNDMISLKENTLVTEKVI